MTTIYIVTSGEYLYHSVDGAFSTRKKADLFIAENPVDHCEGYNDIEERELDERESDSVKTVWTCRIFLNTGVVDSEWCFPRVCGKRFTEAGQGGALVWANSSVSRDHAFMLAAEKRQEYIRTAPGYFNLPPSLTEKP